MDKPTKYGLIALGVLAAGALTVKAVGAYQKVKNFTANIIVKPAFGSIYGLERDENKKLTGRLVIIFKSAITNYSGFDVKVSNLWINLEYLKDGIWSSAGISPQVTEKIVIKNGRSVTAKFPFAISILQVVGVILSNPSTKFRFVTHYEFSGLQFTDTSEFSINQYLDVNKLKDFSSVKTLAQNLLKGPGASAGIDYSRLV